MIVNNGVSKMGFTSNIKELDKWCTITDHIIIVKHGKLAGLVKMEDR